jgi:hypothetical protein
MHSLQLVTCNHTKADGLARVGLQVDTHELVFIDEY